MRAEELIKQVQRVVDKYGDLEVDVSVQGKIEGDKTASCTPIEEIFVEVLKNVFEWKVIISKI